MLVRIFKYTDEHCEAKHQMPDHKSRVDEAMYHWEWRKPKRGVVKGGKMYEVG